MDDAMLSSPDPLNDSPIYYSPQKTRQTTKPRRSLPLRSSSPTKQRFELDVSNGLSPQKLIVTVEAESEGRHSSSAAMDSRLSSPSRRPLKTRERTTTTTIPVKGLSDSEGEEQAAATPKRSRGRPRKSVDTPIQANIGRSGTPTRRNSNKRRSIGDLVDGDDEDDINFQIGKHVEIGRGRGKSRSRSAKGASRKSISSETDGMGVSSVVKKARGRPSRKSAVVDEVMVLEDSGFAHNEDELEDQPEMSGILQPIPPTSTFSESHGQSKSSIALDEPEDLDNFDCETYSRQPVDRSNSRRPSQSQKLGQFTSRVPSPEKSVLSQFAEDSIVMVPVPPSDDQEAEQANTPFGVKGEGNYEDEDDEVGELREFDTILESEEFSMISVDSLPSLLQHLSSPVNKEKAIPAKPVSRGVESLRQASTYEDSFADIPERVVEVITPARRTLAHHMLSVPGTVNNSFSSIPPQILEAATPGRKNHISKFQTANSILGDSFSSVAPDILEAATPGRPLSKPHIPRGKPSYGSDVVSPVSATRSADAGISVLKSTASSGSKQTTLPNPAFMDGRRSVSATQSITTRLPTPDETPSPGENLGQSFDTTNNPKASALSSINEPTAVEDISLIQSYLQSSPPTAARRYSYSTHLRRQSQLQPGAAQTPTIVFSSPSLPPPINIPRELNAAKATQHLGGRPTLSPVARAGQALQNIIVPSSPRSRSHSLGSPFKSPAAERRSSSFSNADLPSPSQEREREQLPHLDLSKNLSTASQICSASGSRQDDPFRSAVQQRSPSPEETVRPYTLGKPRKPRISDLRIATIKSADLSVISDDAMSWQHEEEISAPDNGSSGIQAIFSSEAFEQKWAGERATVCRQIASAGPKQVIVIDSDVEEAGVESCDDEDNFGHLLETINSSSPAPAQAPAAQVPRIETAEKPRRGKIPSPWRKNSKRLVYSDEISHVSSPANLPSVTLVNNLSKGHRSQPLTARRMETTSAFSEEVDEVDISNFQIPQKSNFKPRAREPGNLDLSAFLSPIKPLPVMPKEPLFTRNPSRLTSDPVNAETSQRSSRFVDKSVKKDDPFAPILQKAGFNPSPRKSSAPLPALSQVLFSQAPKVRLFTPSAEDTSTSASQERSPLLSKQAQAINRQQPQVQEPYSPLASDESALCVPTLQTEKENTPAHQDARTLKWTQSLHLATNITQTPLPDRNASPTKSCLRTPAVNFNINNLSPTKNVVFVSSSPVPSPSQETTLSPTQWSKAHWVLLEEILASHEASPDGNNECKSRRRNSTRVISKLLGRKVTSQGEEMRFEQWHLEAVDEFRERVTGWEEKVVAMRVFALIVGAERRRLDVVG